MNVGGDWLIWFNDLCLSSRVSGSRSNAFMRFKTTAKDGLLLWRGDSPMRPNSDFISWGLRAGALVFRKAILRLPIASSCHFSLPPAGGLSQAPQLQESDHVPPLLHSPMAHTSRNKDGCTHLYNGICFLPQLLIRGLGG